MKRLACGAILVGLLAVACVETDRRVGDVLHRLQALVPGVAEAPRDLEYSRLAGHYTEYGPELLSQLGGGVLGGSDLYLFADRSYLYVEWGDVLPETIYDRGLWSFERGVIVLLSDHAMKQIYRSIDRSYVPFRYSVGKAHELRIVGTDENLKHLEESPKREPSFQLLLNSLEQLEHFSSERSSEVFKDLMKRAWRPDYFRE